MREYACVNLPTAETRLWSWWEWSSDPTADAVQRTRTYHLLKRVSDSDIPLRLDYNYLRESALQR